MATDLVYRAAKQSDTDPFEYVLSDETVDRYGDVISADGWDLSNFSADRNPMALFNHNQNAIVGTWENVRVDRKGKRLLGRLKLAAQGTSRLVDEVRRLVEQKILRAVSVGFRPLKSEPFDDKADPDWGPFRYLRQELVECSLVAVPANPNALQIARSYGALPAEAHAQLFGKLARSEQPRSRPGAPGKLARPQPPTIEGATMSKLSKRIEETQKRINTLRDQLATLTNNDDPSEDDLALMEELPNEIEEAQRSLERDRRIESTLAIQVNEPPPENLPAVIEARSVIEPKRPFAMPKRKIEPVDFLVRAAVVHARAYMQQMSLEQSLAESYGNDETTGMVLRAVTNPAMTTVPGWAQELVQQGIGDFLDTLKPASIYAPLSARGARFTFGRNGSIKIPGRAKTPNLAGSWVGEGAPKPVRRLALVSITLMPYKLAVISTFTEEMAAYSTPQIEQVIREAMADDTAVSLDTYLIDNAAASTVRPAGLLNGLVGLTPSAESDPLAMGADLKALAGAIIANGGGRDIVFLLNPAQAISIGWQQTTTGDFIFDSPQDAANKLNATFIVSNTVPDGTVIALDAADFATATGDTPRYSVSDQATIHEEDTSPQPIVGGTPSPATPVRSLWQTDSIGVRMVLNVSWAMRRAGMIAFMEDVTW
ncbi:phage major capsid protein [Sinorhizobium fredii]|uniref:phage major capsid protein n=1 Tax=Rhizobium fredii TaxID=380 RepID=UPI0030A49009